jgi:hypothetical protein
MKGRAAELSAASLVLPLHAEALRGVLGQEPQCITNDDLPVVLVGTLPSTGRPIAPEQHTRVWPSGLASRYDGEPSSPAEIPADPWTYVR